MNYKRNNVEAFILLARSDILDEESSKLKSWLKASMHQTRTNPFSIVWTEYSTVKKTLKRECYVCTLLSC